MQKKLAGSGSWAAASAIELDGTHYIQSEEPIQSKSLNVGKSPAVAGAVYGVYGSASLVPSNSVGTLTTTTGGTATNSVAISYGSTYYMAETAAPVGYGLDPYVYRIAVAMNGNVTVSKSSNFYGMGTPTWTAAAFTTVGDTVYVSSVEPQVKGPVNVYKSPAVAGATYRVYSNAACTQLYGTAAENTLVTTSYGIASQPVQLPVGTYYIKETIAPQGYELDPYVYKLVVSSQNGSPTVVWYYGTTGANATVRYNEIGQDASGTFYFASHEPREEHTPTVKVKKSPAVAGAVYGDYDSSYAQVNSLTTNATGYTNSVELELDTVYYFYETSYPDGYGQDTNAYGVYVSDDFENQRFVAYFYKNGWSTAPHYYGYDEEIPIESTEPVIDINVRVQKTPGNASTAGAEYGLWYNSYENRIGTMTTDSTGSTNAIAISNKPADTFYIVYETKAPEGYRHDTTLYIFDVVYVPGAQKVRVNVYGKANYGLENEGEWYQVSGPTDTYLNPETNTVDVDIIVPSTEIPVQAQVDVQKSPAVAGAEYTVYSGVDTTGTVVGVLRTAATGMATNPITVGAGIYTIVETKAPVGYTLDGNVYHVVVEHDSARQKVTVSTYKNYSLLTSNTYNELLTPRATIRSTEIPVPVNLNIQKSPAVAGAVYEVSTDIGFADGTVVGTLVTTGNGRASSSLEIHPGYYFVRETRAPLGYTRDATTYCIVVTHDPSTRQLSATVYNVGTGTQIGGAQTAGDTTNPTFYVGSAETPVSPKIDVQKSPAVAGAEYTVYGAYSSATGALSRSVGTLTTAASGAATNALPVGVGTYYVKETKAPYGYMRDKTVYKVVIEHNVETQKLTATIYDNATGTRISSNVYDDNSSPTIAVPSTEEYVPITLNVQKSPAVAGAVYGVYSGADVTDTLVGTLTTAASGTATNSLPIGGGTYTVMETKAPVGYARDTAKYRVVVTHNVDTQKISVSIYRNYTRLSVTEYADDSNPTVYIPSTEPKVSPKVKISKASADATFVADNPNYSLAGATYAIYDANATYLGDAITDADGNTEAFDIGIGTYYAVETAPSQGHSLDDAVYTVVVSHNVNTQKLTALVYKNTTLVGTYEYADTSNPTVTVNSTEPPIPGGITVVKTSSSGAVQTADLAGAKFQIVNKNDFDVVYGGTAYASGAVITTLTTAVVSGQAKASVTGLPLGTYGIRETEAPAGHAALVADVDVTLTESEPVQTKTIRNDLETTGTWVPDITKTVNGNAPGGDHGYTFELKDASNAVLATGTANADGSVTWDTAIVYGSANIGETYTYTVTEVAGSEERMVYDSHVLTVTVSVSLVGGQIRITDSYSGSKTFENTRMDPPSFAASGTKSLEGRPWDLEAGEFWFELLDSDSHVVVTTSNRADGTFVFDSVTLADAVEGSEYTFYVREIGGADASIAYDDHVETLHVAVTRSGNALVASVTTDADGNAFTNTYRQPFVLPTSGLSGIDTPILIGMTLAAFAALTLFKASRKLKAA